MHYTLYNSCEVCEGLIQREMQGGGGRDDGLGVLGQFCPWWCSFVYKWSVHDSNLIFYNVDVYVDAEVWIVNGSPLSQQEINGREFFLMFND